MKDNLITIELTEETVNHINFIQEHYWFGMFQQIGLARDEACEYILRDALDDFKKNTERNKK